jgi:hypothetical protein
LASNVVIISALHSCGYVNNATGFIALFFQCRSHDKRPLLLRMACRIPDKCRILLLMLPCSRIDLMCFIGLLGRASSYKQEKAS